MACGSCAMPECRVKARIAKAFATGEDWTVGDEFVVVECTNPDCPMGQCHKECFDQFSDALVDQLLRVSTLVSRSDITKYLWKRGRNGKYDQIQKQCQCACKRGTFIALEGSKAGEVKMRGGVHDEDAANPRILRPRDSPRGYVHERGARQMQNRAIGNAVRLLWVRWP